MRIPIFFFTLALTSPIVALAHGPDGHSGAGLNGGLVMESRGHHVEFVAKDAKLVFYVTGETDKPESTNGAVGRVVYLDGGKSKTIDLVSEVPNILTAKLGTPLKTGTKLVVSAKLADGHDLEARFVTK